MARRIAPILDCASFLRLLWLMLRRRPQITDFSTPKAGLLGNVAAWMARVPHRVYTLRGLKLEGAHGWKLRLLLCAERITCKCAHAVICNSESLRNKAINLGLTYPEKLQILGNGSSNGVDVERFAPGESNVRGHLCIDKNDLVLGFVGRLTKDKGLVELLRAFDQILLEAPNVWLLLVGWFDRSEDALDEKWRVRIATHHRIRHVGFVEDTAPYYRAMDVLILPTYREGFPNVVLEAAASGVPAIATECTGARDSVISEVTGLLIPPESSDAITNAVLNLFANSSKRKRMGKAARRWVLDFYDQKKVLALAVNFYCSLLED
jgi:glycosyltransferase involved in cell wall biosynthesis